MDEPAGTAAQESAVDETLSKTEIQLEREKLKLEQDRIQVERERLNAARERLQNEEQIRFTKNGKFTVTLSTLIMASTICALLGGILGALTATMTSSMHRTARLQEVVNSLAAAAPNENTATNDVPAPTDSANMPAWLKNMKPRGAHPGIAVVVVQ